MLRAPYGFLAFLKGSNHSLSREKAMSFFIFPGDRAAALMGLEEGSEHRQVFRMFANTVIWGAVGVTTAFLFFV